MKSTGMVRKIDNLGRLVIPKELRMSLGMYEGDAIEIFIEGDKVILQKYKPNMACAVTGEVSEQNLSLLDGKLVLSEDGAKYLLNKLQNATKGDIE